MKIELTNLTTSAANNGYIAHFDARLEFGVTLCGLAICRPEKKPTIGWLVVPSLGRDGRRAHRLSAEVRDAIGERGVAAYNAVSGADIEYEPPKRQEEPASDIGAKAGPKAVISTWLDRHEPDDAGLRRTLCAGGEEALRAAGI